MRARLLQLSPVAVAGLVLVLAGLFVLARWQFAADRDLSRFVVAGSHYAIEPPGVVVQPGNGYDGQFAYRLAVDPTQLDGRSHGVVLDSPLRLQRITYPAAASLVALGRASWVPTTLVLVNLLGLAALGLLGALLARDHGRPPVAGLVVPAYFGFATTLGRDLTEITTCALLLAGLLAWRRSRLVPAVVLFSAAVLSRESALLLYAVFVAGEVWTAPAARRLRTTTVAALPAVAFLAWQGICWSATGHVPLLSSSGKNLVLPLQDLAPAVADWLRGAAALERADLIHAGQLGTLVVVVGAAGLALRASRAPVGVKVAWVVSLLLVLALSANVWKGPADFRTAAELHLLSAVVLLCSDRSLRLPGAVLGGATGMTALFRVTSI